MYPPPRESKKKNHNIKGRENKQAPSKNKRIPANQGNPLTPGGEPAACLAHCSLVFGASWRSFPKKQIVTSFLSLGVRAKLRAHVQGFLLHRPSQPQTCLASCLKGKRDAVPVLTLSLDPAPHLIALGVGILSLLEASLTLSSVFTSVILEQQWRCVCAGLYLVLKRCRRKEAHTPLLSHLKLKDQGPGAAANGQEPCLSHPNHFSLCKRPLRSQGQG